MSEATSKTLESPGEITRDDAEDLSEDERSVEQETSLTLDELLDVAERGAESEWVASDRLQRIEKHFGKGPLAKASAFLSGATFKIEERQKKALEEKPEDELTRVEKLKKVFYGITTAGGDKSVFNEMGRKATKVAGKLATSGTIAYASAALLASGFGAPIVSAALLGAAAGRVGYEAVRVARGKERKGRVELEEHYDDYYAKVQDYAKNLLDKRQNLEQQYSDDDDYDIMQDEEFLNGEDINYTQLVDLMLDESKRKLEIESEEEENTEIDLVEEESGLRKNEKKHEFRSGLTSALGGIASGWTLGLLNGGKLATEQASERSAEAVSEFATRFDEGKEAVSIDLDGDSFFHKVAVMKDDAYDTIGQFFGYLKDPSLVDMGSTADAVTAGDYVSSAGGALEGHWHALTEGPEIINDDLDKIVEAANKAAQEFGSNAGIAEKAKIVGNQMKTISAISAGFLAQAFAKSGYERIKSSREDDAAESGGATEPTTSTTEPTPSVLAESAPDSVIVEPEVEVEKSPKDELEEAQSASVDDGESGGGDKIEKPTDKPTEQEIQAKVEKAFEPGAVWVMRNDLDRDKHPGIGIRYVTADGSEWGTSETWFPKGNKKYEIVDVDVKKGTIDFRVEGNNSMQPIRTGLDRLVSVLRPSEIATIRNNEDKEKANTELDKYIQELLKKSKEHDGGHKLVLDEEVTERYSGSRPEGAVIKPEISQVSRESDQKALSKRKGLPRKTEKWHEGLDDEHKVNAELLQTGIDLAIRENPMGDYIEEKGSLKPLSTISNNSEIKFDEYDASTGQVHISVDENVIYMPRYVFESNFNEIDSPIAKEATREAMDRGIIGGKIDKELDRSIRKTKSERNTGLKAADDGEYVTDIAYTGEEKDNNEDPQPTLKDPPEDTPDDQPDAEPEEKPDERKFDLEYNEKEGILTISGDGHYLHMVEVDGRREVIMSKDVRYLSYEIKAGQIWHTQGSPYKMNITSIDVASLDPENPDFTIHYEDDEIYWPRETPIKSKEDLEKLFELLAITHKTTKDG